MSKLHRVHVQEVWIQVVEIEAESKEEATERVAAGEGVVLENEFEYSRTIDDNIALWLVEEELNE